jgi:GDP-L-fucose synthase
MQRLLVLGSKGMLGSALIRESNQKPILTFGLSRNDFDLIDSKLLTEYICSNEIDSIVVAAAKVGGIGANSSKRIDFLVQNIRLTDSIMTSAIKSKVTNLLFVGSSCIYPTSATLPLQESALFTGPFEKSNEAFAISKYFGMKYAEYAQNDLGLSFKSIIPSNLYGPNDNFSQTDGHVLPALINRFSKAVQSREKKISVWGTGTPLREYLYIDDLARAIWQLLLDDNYSSFPNVINIGSGEEVSIAELVTKIANVTGYSGTIEYDTTKPDGVYRKIIQSDFMRQLGWIPQTSLDEGLRLTYANFLVHSKEGSLRE